MGLIEASETVEVDGGEALAELVRRCAADGRAIVDYGVAHEGLGRRPPAVHVRLKQTAQGSGIIEHYERDLTVRVAGGAKFGDVQEALGQTNQFLPIDADDDLTIAEVIHHGVYGPLRMAYGSVRDLMLGLYFVDGTASDNHVGGRTVKNVAGYDLSRFMVGSLGEMGMVYEATLRTYAIPDEVMIVELSPSGPATVGPAVARWMVGQSAPAGTMLEYGEGGWRLQVIYVGSSLSCAAQLRALEVALEQSPEIRIVGSSARDLNRYREVWANKSQWRREAKALVKVVVPPAQTGALGEAMILRCDSEAALNVLALPAHGCVFVGGALGAKQAAQLDAFVNEYLEQASGFRVWHVRPNGGEGIAPFAPAQPDWPMLGRIKKALDPKWLLNPGRMLKREED